MSTSTISSRFHRIKRTPLILAGEWSILLASEHIHFRYLYYLILPIPAHVNECRTVDGQASKQFVSKLAYVPMDMDNHS